MSKEAEQKKRNKERYEALNAAEETRKVEDNARFTEHLRRLKEQKTTEPYTKLEKITFSAPVLIKFVPPIEKKPEPEFSMESLCEIMAEDVTKAIELKIQKIKIIEEEDKKAIGSMTDDIIKRAEERANKTLLQDVKLT